MGGRLFFIIILLFFCITGVQAIQYGISEIEYFNRRDYKAGTQNWSISQADDGLIYFANNDGIVEYDGTAWRLLPKFTNSVTRAVLVHEDRVYVGANGVFGYYEADSLKNFQYYSLDERYGITDIGDFWKIFAFNGKIIFHSEKALCIYSPENGVNVIRAHSRIPTSFLVNGMLLVHDEKLGLLELRQGELFRIPGGEIFSTYAPWAIMPLNNNEIVIGTMNNGLFKWGLKGFEKWNVPASDFLEKNNVFCGIATDDELVFGTIQSGAVVVDKTGNIKMIADKDRGLNNNTVLSMYHGNQGNLWCGLDNGIAKIEYNRAVSFIQGYYDIGTGYCIEKKHENIFLGTNQGLYTIKEKNFASPLKTRDDFKRIEGANGQVWSLFVDEESDKVLCGHNLGVFVVDELKAKKITPQDVNGVWDFRKIPGYDDKLIVGTYGGLSVIERSGNTWQFSHRINGFNESSRFIEWAEDGALWIAHGVLGVFKLYFSDDYTKIIKIKTYHDFKGLKDSLNITLSKVNGDILFTSDHGLYYPDDNGTDFYHSELEAYFSDYAKFPSQIKQDKVGNIWYFINDGVGVLRRQEDGTYKHIYNPLLTLKNKLVSGFESIYFWDEETTFFGVEDGFGQYSVVSDINYYQPFDVHIRPFRNQSTEQEYDEFYSNSALVNNQKHVPVYPFETNNFEVEYSATWFGNSEVEYTTWLDGFEQSWHTWSTSGKRQFTRLPEGDYTFKVKARNMFGVETLPATFKFTVTPPWYRSAVANTVYIVLILSFMVLMWYTTSKLVQKAALKEKIRQKEKFREKEEALRHEALINEKEMIRLRNEKLRNDMLYKEKELANSTMHIVQKNEFLKKIKDELFKIKNDNGASGTDKKVASVIRKIERDIHNESHWEVFETHFDQVHEDFLKRLSSKHTSLTPRELKLAAYLRMNMSSKEIASLMNITPRAVENNRSRLRKKLRLSQGDNLVDYVLNI
jgi:DNA-binding CsgD family transcriptional regulator